MKSIKREAVETLKVVILALIFTVGINYAAAFTWTAPTQSFPNGNVAAPLNVTSTGQIKDGGLTLCNGGCSPYGLLVLSGNVGIGTNAPLRTLHVVGDMRLTKALYDTNNEFGANGQILSSIGGSVPGGGVKWIDAPAGSASLWTTTGNNISNTNSGWVGIGTTIPKGTLHVSSNSYTDIRVSAGTATNAALQLYGPSGDGWGWALLKSGNGDFLINRDTAENTSGRTDLTIQKDTGKIAIGTPNTTSPDTKLVVNGMLQVRGDGPTIGGEVLTVVQSPTGGYQSGLARWVSGSPSDQSLKKNIQSLGSDALDKILKLRGVSFNWKDSKDQATRIGFIAQEVEKVFPEVVYTGNDGIKSVDYQKLVAPLVEAVKSQQTEINELRAEIREIRAANRK